MLEPSLARWIASPSFDDTFNRLSDGERDFEDDVVTRSSRSASSTTAMSVTTALARSLWPFLPAFCPNCTRVKNATSVLAGRQERLQTETREHADARFDRLEHLLLGGSSPHPGVSLADSQQAPTDAEHARLETQVDLARDLLQDSMVVAARTVLERLRDSSEEIPRGLRYRLLTLLGSCALASEAIEEGCTYLEEAHSLRPDHAAALANAAVAAGLRATLNAPWRWRAARSTWNLRTRTRRLSSSRPSGGRARPNRWRNSSLPRLGSRMIRDAPSRWPGFGPSSSASTRR